MNKNVGTLDQQARILIGSVLVLMGLFLPMNPTLQIVLFVVAGIAFITGFVRL